MKSDSRYYGRWAAQVFPGKTGDQFAAFCYAKRGITNDQVTEANERINEGKYNTDEVNEITDRRAPEIAMDFLEWVRLN